MIYFVEDDSSIRELVVYTLNNTGFEAEGMDNAKTLYSKISVNKPELILLDIMLPGESGLEILKKLRSSKETANIPVIMVTAKGTEYDKIIGLDSGADDYISKPFGIMELVSRVKALLRRVSRKEDTDSVTDTYTYEGVCINSKNHTVTLDSEPVVLTLKEFRLLYELMANQGIVLTRDTLLERVWGYDYPGETRTIDVHIRTLRKKLGKYGDIIKTIRGVGYIIGGNA
ncbi:MAG TPA: response regulator transcription factor [Clostridia bacterium]|jgi:two-component system alkaline phosphatase synthesis response regulator PhoP|nr:response regulator transcription factor [Clostridiaceae bacterium]HOF26777.1 response regulator transcription factor [Clostridia bacterium]HOM33842.1 response regulator transcription factor [Clostridia bacterium]HOR89900.1 response regulator transcription factor [Clostridia bacterium]HOT69916.1 response regulator transcription factor [Clostridia bacterium]